MHVLTCVHYSNMSSNMRGHQFSNIYSNVMILIQSQAVSTFISKAVPGSIAGT